MSPNSLPWSINVSPWRHSIYLSFCRNHLHACEIRTNRVTNRAWKLRLTTGYLTPVSHLSCISCGERRVNLPLRLIPTCGCVHVSLCSAAKDMMSGSCYDSCVSCPSRVCRTSGRLLCPQAMSHTSACLYLLLLFYFCLSFLFNYENTYSLILFCFAINQAITPAALSSKICVWVCVHEGRLSNARGGQTCTFCGPEQDVISYWGGTDEICFLFASYVKNSSAPDWTYTPCKTQLIHYPPRISLSLFALTPAHTHVLMQRTISIVALPVRKGSHHAAPRKTAFLSAREICTAVGGYGSTLHHMTQNAKKTNLFYEAFKVVSY